MVISIIVITILFTLFVGMDYWNGGMPHRTHLIIQHVLYSEQ